jgi:NAD(P)-dependent dehydrogenase (short-subunit alcohol dehydrogenase family)
MTDQHTMQDPTTKYPQPQFPEQQQPPGVEGQMRPRPDYGEETYRGSGRLNGKATVITGADSGIGKAVAIAYAREGADVLVSYLNEDEDAQGTKRWVEEAGRKAVLVPGDVADPAHCRAIVQKAVDEFGRVDVLVNNAAYQMTRNSLEEIPDEEWDRAFAINISAFFHLARPRCRTCAPARRSSAPPRSTPTCPRPRWPRMPPPRPRSPTSPRAWPTDLPGHPDQPLPELRPGHPPDTRDRRRSHGRRRASLVVAVTRITARNGFGTIASHPSRC